MNFIKYLNNIKLFLFLIIVVIIIFDLNIILDSSLSNILSSLIYINVLTLITTVIFLVIGYLSQKKKYKILFNYINNQSDEKKYAITDCFYKIIENKVNEHEEELNGLREELQEINDYMTKWVHEIKIPIAVLEIISKRVSEIEKEERLSKDINIEIKRIENLVDQALYTSRAGNYSSDFLIEEVNLSKVIKEVVKKHKYLFIYNKIEIEISNTDVNVLTDKKWITHIIEQIIDNSCKYTNKFGKIQIYTLKDDKGTQLHIKDNGIGIVPQDIDRIFDKGFTGENGRKRTKSTGMGLYISKKILHKLSHNIEVVSSANKFCDVYITFYNLSDYFNIT
ncbi:sensor histidine kinase [Romboutsia maritimum]|uniref:histidine kinase n=1 Tax=Romboutsia maritimum TaxID=2020948 RepID=A0A255IFK5_9FIRM|nr:sensor histidine kinase [Romboutsia maritimum]RDY23887.1 sensor histidine kinase [Romboutsia maritimum]